MFDSVVFAGGGHRCWWQAGWWDVAARDIGLRPSQIAGVSAGAATACLVHASDAQTGLDFYQHRLHAGSRNFYPQHLFKAGQKVLPHESIYREALLALLGGEAFARLRATAPSIRIMFARPAAYLPAVLATAAGLAAYNMEKYWRRPLHPTFGLRLGFTPQVVLMQSCADVQSLIDLIMASSSTPPFTAVQTIDGAPALDGGLVDNVPVAALDVSGVGGAGRILVLLTRRYRDRDPVFEHEGRVYVQPSRPVAASSWDYTSPGAYRATYQQGRDDAILFLKWLEA